MKFIVKKIVDSIKYIKANDLLAPFIFIIVLPFSLIFRLINKLRKRSLWLICENGNTARDNGYHFYKYIRENHADDYCFYVIDKQCTDFNKVKNFGNIIQFKSLKHWLYYLAANYNISSQKNGNPNQILFYFLHVSLGLFKNRVFLQHGITKDNAIWLYYKNTKFKYFICGAKREYDYIKSNYGYPTNAVQYTGFPRFDNLHDMKIEKKQILVMPTWRNWLGRETNALKSQIDFRSTSFYKNWNDFLNNTDLNYFLEKENLTLIFYPHINMQKYLNYFTPKSKNIKIVDTTVDIQEILKSSALMITDYSSVYMDFAYLRKPIIYFQFDIEEYRKNQYMEGYFDYFHDGFGPVVTNSNELVKKIIQLYDTDFSVNEKYKDRMLKFFPLYDKHNCSRIYELLKKGEC